MRAEASFSQGDKSAVSLTSCPSHGLLRGPHSGVRGNVGRLTHQGRNNKVIQPLPLNPETVTLVWFDESSLPGAEDQSGVLILSETDKPAPRGFFLSDGGSSFPLLSVCWGFSV